MEYLIIAVIVVAAVLLVWRSLRRSSCPAGNPEAKAETTCCGICVLADSCGQKEDAEHAATSDGVDTTQRSQEQS